MISFEVFWTWVLTVIDDLCVDLTQRIWIDDRDLALFHTNEMLASESSQGLVDAFARRPDETGQTLWVRMRLDLLRK
jgi:hypothetical protein